MQIHNYFDPNMLATKKIRILLPEVKFKKMLACGHVKGEKNKGGNTRRKLLFFTLVLDH